MNCRKIARCPESTLFVLFQNNMQFDFFVCQSHKDQYRRSNFMKVRSSSYLSICSFYNSKVASCLPKSGEGFIGLFNVKPSSSFIPEGDSEQPLAKWRRKVCTFVCGFLWTLTRAGLGQNRDRRTSDRGRDVRGRSPLKSREGKRLRLNAERESNERNEPRQGIFPSRNNSLRASALTYSSNQSS